MVGFGENGFDATAEENQPTRSVIPAGEYPAIIVASERVETKAGNGWFVKLQWQIVKGEMQNRVVFQNINVGLSPEKKQAVQIAKGQLSEICRAVGVLNPKDSSELHNKLALIKVKVRVSDQYGDQNEVMAVKPVHKAEPAKETVPADANPWG